MPPEKIKRGPATHIRKIFRNTHDPLWQLNLGIISVIILQYFTNDMFLPISKGWIIGVEAAISLGLIVVTTEGYKIVSRNRRSLAIGLISIIAIINVFSLIFLINALVNDIAEIGGGELLYNGLVIYVTNILMFALLYWEMDGGGPDQRVARTHRRDFLFTQMIHSGFARPDWLPGFIDYIYLSTSNVTNFASSDTPPLTHRAKILMTAQSLVAVLTVVLVLARAINILH